MPPRQKKIDFDPAVRGRNMDEIAGRHGMGGVIRAGFPGAGIVGGVAQSVLQQATADEQDSAAAQLLVLEATSDSIASGGDYVVFDENIDEYGFDGVATAGDDTWTHPITATYLLIYEHTWDTYEGGGTLALEIDGKVVRTITSDTTGQKSIDVIAYYALAGSEGKIKVTQSSGSAQTCDARLQIIVTDPADDANEWVKVASADVYEMIQVDSDWWTTEGQSGLTVSKRDANWVESSSFEASALADAGINRVRGIAFDGTDLWLSGAHEVLARYDTAGTLLSSFAVTGGAHNGLAFDGTDLWVVEGDLAEIYRYTTAGTLAQTINLPAGALYFGLDHYDSKLWVLSDDDELLAINPADGSVTRTIDVSGAATGLTGVWIRGGTLYVAKDGAGVYRWNRTVGSV